MLSVPLRCNELLTRASVNSGHSWLLTVSLRTADKSGTLFLSGLHGSGRIRSIKGGTEIMVYKWGSVLVVVAVTSLLTACGSSGNSTGSTTASTTSASSTGTISMAATDAPVDGVSRVQVTFNAIGLKPHNGPMQMLTLTTPRVINNLLDLTGNASQSILGSRTVPAGKYDYVRLFVVPDAPNSFVDDNAGGRHNLVVPGQQGNSSQGTVRRFVQLNSGFTVPAGGNADFTIDFQLRKALVQPPGQKGDYLLRPALRLANNVEAGTITGSVADSLVTDPSCTSDLSADTGDAVYLYQGANVTPGDIQIDSQGQPVAPNSPLVTANVKQDPDTGTYGYTIAFVQAGTYTIAFTCQAHNDQPETAEKITFFSRRV